jgi:hypothetical protein
MGQPINVIEKPTGRPGVVRFETDRWLTGMGHERFASADEVLGNRTVDELARRLFATGMVISVHVNGNIITVQLAGANSSERLLDVIRSLHVRYGDEAEQSTGQQARQQDAASS